MPIEVFLNDLSVPSGSVPTEDACEHLRSVVRALRELRKINSDIFLNTRTGINSIYLGEGNSIAALRNSQLCVEEGQFLKLLQDRSPFDQAIEANGGADFSLTEFKIANPGGDFDGEGAEALGLSWALDGIGLSFETHAIWCATPVSLKRLEVDVESGELSETLVEARNLSAGLGAMPFEEFLKEPAADPVVDGADLWARRAELLPCLTFLPRVRGQLEGMKSGERVFVSALRRLHEINSNVQRWRDSGDPHPNWSCHMRPESENRINKGLVDFVDAEGVKATYSDHADFGPAEGRIHIRLEAKPSRHAIVGHVGRKIGIG